MAEQIILLTIVGMGLVTYLPRLLPVWALSGRELPPVVTRWLSYVPTAVLSALLLPDLLLSSGAINVSTQNLGLIAAVPTFLVAWRTKSFFGTVAVGMGCLAAMRYLGW